MKKTDSKTMVFSALCTALFVICSWITVPSAVPFTMQTFAVAFLSAFLGAKRGCISISTYILLGIVGIPVFSGFRSGLPAILDVTGGYVLGFFPFCILTGILSKKSKRRFAALFLLMLAGLLACYLFGTLWYSYIYLSGTKSLLTAATICVFPFIIPDIIKISLAAFMVKKAENLLK